MSAYDYYGEYDSEYGDGYANLGTPYDINLNQTEHNDTNNSITNVIQSTSELTTTTEETSAFSTYTSPTSTITLSTTVLVEDESLGMLLPVTCTFAGLLFILGVVGNGIVVGRFARRDEKIRRLNTTMHSWTVFQLAISNFLLVIGIPIFLASKFSQHEVIFVVLISEFLLYFHYMSTLVFTMIQHSAIVRSILIGSISGSQVWERVIRPTCWIWIVSCIAAILSVAFYTVANNRLKGISIFLVALFIASAMMLSFENLYACFKKSQTDTEISKSRQQQEASCGDCNSYSSAKVTLGFFAVCWAAFLVTYVTSLYGVYQNETMGQESQFPIIGLAFICANAALSPYVHIFLRGNKPGQRTAHTGKDLTSDDLNLSSVSRQSSNNEKENNSVV